MAEHLYQTITADLRRGILDGRYAEGETLPSENELASYYNTTRVTIRRSLQTLAHEQLIEPRQGRGYFVLPPPHRRFTFQFGETDSDFIRLRQVNMQLASPEVARQLELPEGSPVVVTRRLFYRDRKPVSFEEKFIPYERGMPIIELELNYVEFPELFAGRYVPMTIRTAMEIDTAAAPEDICTELGLEPGIRLMVLRRTVLQGESRPIGFGRQYLAPDYGPITAVSGYGAR